MMAAISRFASVAAAALALALRAASGAGTPKVDPDAFAFYPEPRIERIDAGEVPLSAFGTAYSTVGDVPQGAVALFTDEMERFFGMKYRRSDVGAKIVFALADSPAKAGLGGAIPEADYAKIRFDGFAVAVTETNVVVAAKEPPGVAYGAILLANAVKMASGDAGAARTRKFTVVDWPRLAKRPLIDMLRTHGHKAKYEPGFYAGILKRFCMASRFNMFGFEPGSYYRWERGDLPKIPVNAAAWTRQDFEAVVDAVNSCGMMAFPRMNGLGHVRGWPLAGEREIALYGEDGTRAVICTSKPETRRMMEESFNEVLDICSRNPRFAAKYFHAGLDEVRWQTAKVAPEKRCPLCAGLAKKDVFLEWVKWIYGWCRSRGVRMVMNSDMICRNHNGLRDFRCADVERDIPADVIYDAWSSLDFEELKEQTARGHEAWKVLTSYHDDPVGEECISGCGLFICTFNWWLGSLSWDGGYGLMAQAILADSMWREPPRAKYADGAEKLERWGDFIARNWSRKPIPHGTELFVPVPLGAAATLAVTNSMPRIDRLGRIPVALAERDGGLFAAEAGDGAVEIAVDRKAASLSFLHAAHVPRDKSKRSLGISLNASPLDGFTVAEYVVKYSDGTVETVPVKYGWNAPEWLYRAVHPHGRFYCYVAECRAAWIGKKNCAGLYEWVNPHPEKKIASVAAVRKWKRGNILLFAVTAREVGAVAPRPMREGRAVAPRPPLCD